MAQECMNIFEHDKLPLVANVEQVRNDYLRIKSSFNSSLPQCCATGLNAEGRTPKTLVEEMVPLLDSREVMSVIHSFVVTSYP